MTTTESQTTVRHWDAQTRWLVAAMALAAFIAVLNGTTVTASLATLAPELHTSMAGVVWVTTVYLVAASASVPLVGWLTDRWGAGRVLQIGLVGFAAASVACGFAWDLSSMLLFRFVQGLAGGMLEPAALAVVGTITPTSRMGRVMGFVSLAINVGPVAGPLVGGALSGAGAWSWIFWVNVPIAVLVSVAAWQLLPAERGRVQDTRVDALGLILLPPGFVFVLLGLNRWGAGASAVVSAALATLGLMLIALYVRHALRATTPLLDVRLLRTPSFAAALSVMSIVGLTMYTQLTVLPELAERDLGLAAGSRGVPVATLGVGLMISMTLAGRMSDTTGPRLLVRFGAATTAVAALLLSIGHHTWPPPVVLGVILTLGLAFGAMASPTFASVYRVLPPAAVGQGTAALFIVVQLFASAGVTVVGFLLEATDDPVGAAYVMVAGVTTVAAVASGLLPGRTDGDT